MNNYFDRLDQALDEAARRAYESGAEFEGEELVTAFSGGVNYNATSIRSLRLTKYKGSVNRAATRALTVVIYRMPSGKYELTSYIA